jgi:hypothetical protein
MRHPQKGGLVSFGSGFIPAEIFRFRAAHIDINTYMPVLSLNTLDTEDVQSSPFLQQSETGLTMDVVPTKPRIRTKIACEECRKNKRKVSIGNKGPGEELVG